MSKSKSANKAGGAQAYKKLLRRIERLEFKTAMVDNLLRLMRDLEFHWRGTPGFTEDENNQFLLLMNSFFDALDDYIRAEGKVTSKLARAEKSLLKIKNLYLESIARRRPT